MRCQGVRDTQWDKFVVDAGPCRCSLSYWTSTALHHRRRVVPFRVALVPYRQANPETREAFLAGLKRLRGMDGMPDEWTCTQCGQVTPGEDIHISYGLGVDSPQPACLLCPDDRFGFGSDLRPGRLTVV